MKKICSKTKAVFIFFALFSSFPALAVSKKSVDHVGYLEIRNGVRKELWGRKIGSEWVIDRRRGDLSACCLEKAPLNLECLGIPPIETKPETVLKKEEDFLGDKLQTFETQWLLKVKMEPLPLNEEEIRINGLLRPFGIQEIFLEGGGQSLFLPDKNGTVAEKILLSGFLVKNGIKESIQIEWASGREP